MATAINNVTFESLKEDILRVFEKLHQKLDERKQVLMGQLLAIKEEAERSTDLDRGIRQLKETKELMLANLVENVIEREREDIEKMFDDKIKEAEARKLAEKCCMVKLRCYTAKLEESIAQIRLVEDIPVYASKLAPVIQCGSIGSGHGEFNAPRCICIDANDTTNDAANNVFVADSGNKRIQVVSKAGEYVNAFSMRNLKDPYGVAVTDQFVYVTDEIQHNIVQFSRDGKFIRTAGFYGLDAPLAFNRPRGIAAYNEKLYVCDCGNHRIQVVGTSLKYIEAFRSKELLVPTDIHITATILHVLPQTDNIVHLFANPGYAPLQIVKLTGQEYNMTVHLYFTVDQSGNYLISAYNEHHIRVFDNTGTLRHIIGEGHMRYPSGITVDSNNNIICITGTDGNNMYQMY